MKTLATALTLSTLLAGGALAQTAGLPPTQFIVVGCIGNLSMYTSLEVAFWNEKFA